MNRLSDFVRKNEIIVSPVPTKSHPLFKLALPVFFQPRHEGRGQREGLDPRVRLSGVELPPVSQPDQIAADRDGAPLPVHIFPLQPGGFIRPGSRPKQERAKDSARLRSASVENLHGLFRFQHVRLALLLLRDFDGGQRILQQHFVVERVPDRAAEDRESEAYGVAVVILIDQTANPFLDGARIDRRYGGILERRLDVIVVSLAVDFPRPGLALLTVQPFIEERREGYIRVFEIAPTASRAAKAAPIPSSSPWPTVTSSPNATAPPGKLR